jgi:hypothetical protein
MIAATTIVRPPGIGETLRGALRDFYEESWRFVLLNSALSAYVLAVLGLATVAPIALVLLLGAGPIAAALVSAAVIVVETGSLTFLEVAESLRRCFKRGVALAAVLGLGAVATGFGVFFYGGTGTLAWPLAVLVLYLGGIFALFQIVLWPLAFQDRERPLGKAAHEAGLLLLRRPAALTGLGLALLVVNLIGIVLAVLPFLTMTVAYSALAAARFAVQPAPLEEVEPWRV